MRILVTMPHRLPVVAEAMPTPELEVAPPSLAVAISTAMVLVDYALAGLAVPSPEPQTVARDLPPDLVEASHPVRAVLAHGTVLRDVLLAQLPPAHAGHTDWPPLRSWLADLDDDRILGLLEAGIRANLTYDQPMHSDADVPAQAVAGLRGTKAKLRRDGSRVLDSWRVADPVERATELLDPATVRAILLALLDGIWDRWIAGSWRDQLAGLRGEVQRAPTPPSGCGGAQWVSLVTGLRPDPQYAAAADRAHRVTLMPCPGLGRSLSLCEDGDRLVVLYTPQRGVTGRQGAAAPRDRPGIALDRLAPLAPTMQALGDPTRLAIVLQLLEHGPLSMQALTDALQVHQSTVSRQVAALRRAGLVEPVDADDQRRIQVRRAPLREACRTLQEALE